MGKYTQFYSLHTVKNKAFDGEIETKEILEHGDFGIGTFNNIDGEMIVIDGSIYRTKADGSAVRVTDLTEKTPYAIVSKFSSDIDTASAQQSLDALQRTIDDLRDPSDGSIYAVEVSGLFKWARTRAPHPSFPPYKDLTEIISEQPCTSFNDIYGTIVGFYTPGFLSAFGVPGYHLHFIDRSRSLGGHLQDAFLTEGVIRIQRINEMKIFRPGGEVTAI